MNPLYLELATKWKRLHIAAKAYNRYLLYAAGQRAIAGSITEGAQLHLDRAFAEMENASIAFIRAGGAIARQLKN